MTSKEQGDAINYASPTCMCLGARSSPALGGPEGRIIGEHGCIKGVLLCMCMHVHVG